MSKLKKEYKEEYNHVLPIFAEEVNKNFKILDILEYYPYGQKTDWSHWTGNYNLKDLHKEKRNKNKTPNDLVLSIISETSRAMGYLMTHGNYDGFDRQRIEAFCLSRLFLAGDIDWTKKPLVGLTSDEKEKLYALHDKRYKLVQNNVSDESQRFTLKRMKSLEQRSNYEALLLKGKLHNRKKYGIYFVKHMPLMQYGNCADIPKVLYTKQQLCAIDHMVMCAFENLC